MCILAVLCEGAFGEIAAKVIKSLSLAAISDVYLWQKLPLQETGPGTRLNGIPLLLRVYLQEIKSIFTPTSF